MITSMFPLPKREFMKGQSFSGYFDKNRMMGETVRSMISREIMDLPVFFYKLFGQFGALQCEWIVASPTTIDVFNITNMSTEVIIPISCKYRGYIQAKRSDKPNCYSTTGLFFRGIEYLLTRYPCTSSLDYDTKPMYPAYTTGYGAHRIQLVSNVPMFLGSCVEKAYGMHIEGARTTDAIYNNMLLSADAAFAVGLLGSLSDYSYQIEPSDFDIKDFNVIGFVEDVLSTTGEEITTYLHKAFFDKPMDPVTMTFLMNPGYTPISQLAPYISKDKEMFGNIYNVAMQEANSTINFRGEYLPFWSNEVGSCDAFSFCDSINSSLSTHFGVEGTFMDVPKYGWHDMFYPMQNNETNEYYFKILNTSMQDLFLNMQDENGIIRGGTSVTVSRNMLDEIFIVITGQFGTVCYYVPLSLYHLINPMIINDTQLGISMPHYG